ncbi:MAG: DUF4080 domain-containing protein [Alphaproteobacteria bacterium]
MIVLATINAKYIHSSFALRYLKANLKEFEEKTTIIEFNPDDKTNDVAEKILSYKPQYVGLSIYLWNVEAIKKVIQIIKSVAPDVKIIIGGPEVDDTIDSDWTIYGEGEFAFYDIIKNNPKERFISKCIPDLSQIKMPYYLYKEDDIKNRMVYVESTRGCPFSCEFCLSSNSDGVRFFDVDLFLSNMKILLDKGLKHFKFIDRTFNLKFAHCKKILDFFYDNYVEGLVLHFEVFPDKISEQLMSEIKRFPQGALHLEAGIQTFFEPSLKLISRKQDEEKTLKNLDYIMHQTGADIHADLVFGLPASTIQTIEIDFNKIIKLKPQELQLGILKKLKGAPIKRHDETHQMKYYAFPPYEILQTKDISFNDMQRLKRFARYFDLFYEYVKEEMWLFDKWLKFSDFVWETYKQTHKISEKRRLEILNNFKEREIND